MGEKARETYYKKLAHMIIDAKKSQNLQLFKSNSQDLRALNTNGRCSVQNQTSWRPQNS